MLVGITTGGQVRLGLLLWTCGILSMQQVCSLAWGILDADQGQVACRHACGTLAVNASIIYMEAKLGFSCNEAKVLYCNNLF